MTQRVRRGAGARQRRTDRPAARPLPTLPGLPPPLLPSLPPALPFGSRWHLEVSADTYLLIEAAPHPATDHESRPARPLATETHRPAETGLLIEIDLLALGREWDTGAVLSAAEAADLLAALGGPAPAHAACWIYEPGWLTLCGHPVACQLELTPPITAALVSRLQSVLAERKA